MNRLFRPHLRLGLLLPLAIFGCGRDAADPTGNGSRSESVATVGAIEVTARLADIPAGAIFKRDLYDYATILKYEVMQVHRGKLHANTIYVGHYNPTKARKDAADRRVKTVGGTVTSFQAGNVHRMALEVPIEDHFAGAIVNKHFGQETGPLYWAVWTDRADQ